MRWELNEHCKRMSVDVIDGHSGDHVTIRMRTTDGTAHVEHLCDTDGPRALDLAREVFEGRGGRGCTACATILA